MFLIRMAFWLVVIIMLLPTDREQQSEVLGTAQAAVKDVSGFCDRNPDVCVKGMDAFQLFMAKAQFGAGMVMGFIEDHANKEQAAVTPESADLTAPMPLKPAAKTPAALTGGSQDTLRPGDLEPAWHGRQGT